MIKYKLHKHASLIMFVFDLPATIIIIIIIIIIELPKGCSTLPSPQGS